jgi:TonB family protein
MRALLAVALATVACAGHLSNTKVISTGRPVYPDSLRALGIEGRVVVEVEVDSTGQAEPGSAMVLSSTHPGFDQAAIDFVNTARFRPARRHGHAVPATVTLPIDFKVERRSAGGVFLANQVDQAPALLTTERAVRPAGVAATGSEVQVLMEAVIDTNGRAEPGSVRVVSTPAAAFATPATAYVLNARFSPGFIGTKKVRVLMTVAVPFAPR